MLWHTDAKRWRWTLCCDGRVAGAANGRIWPDYYQAHHFNFYAPEKIEYGMGAIFPASQLALWCVDRRLEKAEWLAGDDYTIADIAAFPWSRTYETPGVDINDYPMSPHGERMMARPAVERGMKVGAELREDLSKIDPKEFNVGYLALKINPVSMKEKRVSIILIRPEPQGLSVKASAILIAGLPLMPCGLGDTVVVTHGHVDHACPGHKHVIATSETLAIMAVPISGENFTAKQTPLRYGESLDLGDVAHSYGAGAGHVLGSAQIVIDHNGQRVVVSGDYKRKPDPTCLPFKPTSCDVCNRSNFLPCLFSAIQILRVKLQNSWPH